MIRVRQLPGSFTLMVPAVQQIFTHIARDDADAVACDIDPGKAGSDNDP